MPKSYRVFTGAPLARGQDHLPALWQTVSTGEVSPPLLRATIDHAAQRISLLYRNVIFDGGEEDPDTSYEWGSQGHGADGTTNILWPSTHPVDESAGLCEGSQFRETFQTDLTGDEETLRSEGSSISRFPDFNFSLNTIFSLASVSVYKRGEPSSKATLLLGILEVDGLTYVTIKAGQQAGTEVALLKLIVGDEHGAVCKILAWRETAEVWSGVEKGPALKRGDIVLFENILASASSLLADRDDSNRVQLTASPNLKSSAQICFRTLPYAYDDERWRPDLRLADSVPAVRKVGELVQWMQRVAGILPAH